MVLERLPLFPLQTVLFPGMFLPLHIFEPRYRKLFAERADCNPIFGVILTRSGNEVGDRPEVHAVGTGAELLRAIRYDDGRVDLAIRGARRFSVLDGHWNEGFLTASVEWLPAGNVNDEARESVRLATQVERAFAKYLKALAERTGQRVEPPKIAGDPAAVAYAVCAMMPFGTAASQRLLEAEPGSPLLLQLLHMLRRERELLAATGIGGEAVHHPGRRFSAN